MNLIIDIGYGIGELSLSRIDLIETTVKDRLLLEEQSSTCCRSYYLSLAELDELSCTDLLREPAEKYMELALLWRR